MGDIARIFAQLKDKNEYLWSKELKFYTTSVGDNRPWVLQASYTTLQR